MRRILRPVVLALVAGVLGVTLAIVPTQFSPEQAHAAVSPNIPPPISVLPSLISGVTGTGSGTAALTAKAQLVRSSVVMAVVADALGKQKAGLPLVKTEADLIAAQVKKIRLPAFKPTALMKAAGPVSLAMMVGEVGLWMGNDAIEVLGIGGEGNLCGHGVDGWVSTFNHVDCAGFAAMTAEAVAAANADVTEGVSGGRVCKVADPGRCLTLVGLGITGGPQGIPYRYYLFRSEGTPLPGIFWEKATGELRSGTSGLDPAAADTLGMRCKAAQQGGTSFRCIEAGSVSSGAANELVRYSPDQFNTPGGTVAEVVSSESDPERRFECRIVGTDGVGYSAMSAPFRESTGSTSPIVCPDLPSGVDADEFSIWEVGGGQEHKLTPDVHTTPEYDHAKTTYPDCASSVCLLKLHKQGTDCHSLEGLCADWFEDPNKTTKYSCTNGPYAAPLAECTVYKPTFQPGAKTSPAPYGDPTTGDPLPNSAPNPSGLSGPVSDPETNRECFPSGWDILNPVEWVLKPVKCALEWAFVPRASVVNSTLADMRTRWDTTTLVKVGASISALEFITPNPGGCHGITVSVFFLGPPFQIMNACPGSGLETMAMWSRVFGNVGVTILGLVGTTRHLARIIGYGGLGSSS